MDQPSPSRGDTSASTNGSTELNAEVENELSTLGARDALVLAAICVPPERPRASRHKLRHALALRLVGARRSMKNLERRGYLEPGWRVDSLGAHCQTTDVGRRVATAVAVIVNVAPAGGPLGVVDFVVRFLLNRRFRLRS